MITLWKIPVAARCTLLNTGSTAAQRHSTASTCMTRYAQRMFWTLSSRKICKYCCWYAQYLFFFLAPTVTMWLCFSYFSYKLWIALVLRFLLRKDYKIFGKCQGKSGKVRKFFVPELCPVLVIHIYNFSPEMSCLWFRQSQVSIKMREKWLFLYLWLVFRLNV